ncbi:carbohydrate kinase family protein [Leadbettera azotonutricia]|uniref:Putative PfkB family carbohydrate kinase n=1 Tax=Leadbettera azotonutricia (strain ATCC BAA-888 / DSM 13862 / ZAS-9) TaxID=545695 RepID=F5Y9X2_LEAAZ|nr:adenosine kinase [Leadbettera azotonutricia]AEF83335.1 putative PfkB family carbohydrate kinase [Leadbettera azotonutricia ZAS-9]
MEELELLCIGNALVDVFAQGEEDIDFRFGLIEPVQHVPMDKLREVLAVLPEFSAVSGGGAANVAKIASMLGLKAGFIGALGSDQFGRVFEKDLSDAGVQSRISHKALPTGACLILQMPDGRVKIAASPSAALDLNEKDIDEDAIRQAKVVVLDGFMLERRKLVCHILELAYKYGTAVALDASTTGLAEERAVEIVTYARAYPMILFMNEDESRAFYRALSQEKDLDGEGDKNNGISPEMARLFQDFTAQDVFPIVVVKLGKRGAVVFAGGNMYREETIPVIPLETTGAGDAFSAAFLAAWIRDRSLGECAAIGNKAAREVLDVKGTQLDPSALKYLEKELR